jgi:hypothetical protein
MKKLTFEMLFCICLAVTILLLGVAYIDVLAALVHKQIATIRLASFYPIYRPIHRPIEPNNH